MVDEEEEEKGDDDDDDDKEISWFYKGNESYRLV